MSSTTYDIWKMSINDYDFWTQTYEISSRNTESRISWSQGKVAIWKSYYCFRKHSNLESLDGLCTQLRTRREWLIEGHPKILPIFFRFNTHCSASHPARLTKPKIRILGIVRRAGCVWLKCTLWISVQSVKGWTKGIVMVSYMWLVC